MLPPHLQDALEEAQIELPRARHSLLLVDDEPDNLDVLSAVLAGSAEIHTAQSGAEALALIASGRTIDLVIADQRMDGMTGVELLTRLANERPDIARIVLTAYGDVQPMLDAVNRAGVWRFLVKPFEPEDLRATVSETLRVRDNALLLERLAGALDDRRRALERTLHELRETEEQLLAMERLSTVGQAAAGIAHDLRNLSTIMSAMMAEMSRHPVAPSVVAAVRAADRGMSSLIDLLDRVRELARPDEQGVNLEPTDLEQFLGRTAAYGRMQTGGHPVLTETEPGVATARIDTDRIAKGLLALVDNAARASAPHEPVRIRARSVPPPSCPPSSRPREIPPANRSEPPPSAGDWLCIEVADRGCGMDYETLARSVEPFFSGFSPARLGLGLEVARLAARAHGGVVEIESEPGEGTVARMLLPLGLSHGESDCS